MKKGFILVINLSLSLLFINPVSSQNYIDLLKVEYSLSKGNKFKTHPNSSNVYEWVVDATVPIVLSENNTLLTGFLYENSKVIAYAGMDQINLFTLNLKLGINKIYSAKWSATYLFLPKLSSDLQTIKSNDFQMGAVTIFKLSKNAYLNYKFGAYYNFELSGPFLVPLVGIYYQKSKFEANIMLPLAVDLNYSILSQFRVGFKFSGFIKSFHLNDTFNGMSQYISKANNEIGGYLGFSKGNVNLIAMLGTSIGRSYRTYEIEDRLGFSLSAIKFGDNRNQLNTDFADGLVVRTSLIYRFTFAEKE